MHKVNKLDTVSGNFEEKSPPSHKSQNQGSKEIDTVYVLSALPTCATNNVKLQHVNFCHMCHKQRVIATCELLLHVPQTTCN